jgi:hypothetical protein
VTTDLAAADELIAAARSAGDSSGEPDLEAVTHSLAAARARRAGDLAALRAEAAAFTAYGAAEGVPSVSAEAAVLWLEGGEPDRAREVLLQLAGGGLAGLPRDVDFLLTTASLVQVAAALCGDGEGAVGGLGGGQVNGAEPLIAGIAAQGAELLEPYAGRAVINAGAVTFHGVVDDCVFRAYAALRGLRGALPGGGAPGSGGAVGGVAARAAEAGGAGLVAAGVVAGWRDRAASCYLRRVGPGGSSGSIRRPSACPTLRGCVT